MKFAFCTALFALTSTAALAQTPAAPVNIYQLTVKIDNITSNQGSLMIAVCSQAHFLKGGCEAQARIKITDLKDNQVVFKNLPAGTYAVQMFQDLNDNFKLDTGAMGIPTEPFAVSNNAKGHYGPPKFEDAAINLNSDTTISISFDGE